MTKRNPCSMHVINKANNISCRNSRSESRKQPLTNHKKDYFNLILIAWRSERYCLGFQIFGRFQISQRISSSKLVLRTVESRFKALNYYENGSIFESGIMFTGARKHQELTDETSWYHVRFERCYVLNIIVQKPCWPAYTQRHIYSTYNGVWTK